VISCEGLGKRYGRQWVLRRVSLELESGSCLLVTGSNGSGKSTLLKLLAGLEPASEGSVATTFDRRAEMGYAAADLRLYPDLSGREHVVFSSEMRGLPRNEGLLERVGLADKADEPTGNYSTGMRVRLKLALALQGKPLALLLDEPGAGLDESGRALLDEIVAEQRGRGVVIIATNDEGERRFGDYELRLGD
jgi:ABC-type multidrug transport system ATPase subunit